jgi:hypothetical protein
MVLVLLAVVGARFLVPLLIPRYPLPGIVASLVLDGVDQTIFQALGFDPPGYQGYDKAMDVYYLAIAYLSTMRNWTSQPAVRVAKFLYFYRLLGVAIFEQVHWRPLLLLFPNTFEYFFIAYELVRLRWSPARYGLRYWVTMAAAIWVVVKLPQEYWIHIAKLDVTDLLAEQPWLWAVLAGALLALAGGCWFGVRPRLPAVDHGWRVHADPLPEAMDTATERSQWIAAHWRVRSRGTGEKVVLVGLLSVIYAQVLPGLKSTTAELFLGIAVFVVINAAVVLWAARRSHAISIESHLAAFGVRALLNTGLIVLADALLDSSDGELNVPEALFFVYLLSLITLLADRYRPVYELRFGHSRTRPQSDRVGSMPTPSNGEGQQE